MSIGGKKEQKGGEAKLQPGSACLQSVTSYGLKSKANRHRERTLKNPPSPHALTERLSPLGCGESSSGSPGSPLSWRGGPLY